MIHHRDTEDTEIVRTACISGRPEVIHHGETEGTEPIRIACVSRRPVSQSRINMKTTIDISVGKRLLVLLVCALCASVVNITAQDFKTVHDGVEYAQVVHKLGIDPVKINLLRLDLKKVRLDVHHAMDAAIGTEKTSSIATRHAAVAAINAGFFRLDTSIFAGDAAGTLMIDNQLLSESRDARSSIGILNGTSKTEVFFGHPIYMGSINGEKFTGLPLDGINRERKEGEVIAYTPAFGHSTLTTPNGVEMIVENGKVSAIVERGSSRIPSDGFVLSVEGEDAKSRIDMWRIGSRIRLSIGHKLPMYDFQADIEMEQARRKRLLTFPDAVLYKMEDVTNGIPQLIKNGKIDITWEQEKASKAFVETRHPRTAVAKLRDGKFLMITVDGRQPGVSVGMNLQELAEYLLGLGAVDAMNLDGGGSTTMFLDGKIVNTPSDKEGERKIGDAILVTLRTKR